MSCNKPTRIRLVENGRVVKTIPNAILNYNLDYNSLKKFVGIVVRLSPQDPIYDIDTILIQKDGDDVELDDNELEKLKVLIKNQNISSFQCSNGDNFLATVVIKGDGSSSTPVPKKIHPLKVRPHSGDNMKNLPIKTKEVTSKSKATIPSAPCNSRRRNFSEPNGRDFEAYSVDENIISTDNKANHEEIHSIWNDSANDSEDDCDDTWTDIPDRSPVRDSDNSFNPVEEDCLATTHHPFENQNISVGVVDVTDDVASLGESSTENASPLPNKEKLHKPTSSRDNGDDESNTTPSLSPKRLYRKAPTPITSNLKKAQAQSSNAWMTEGPLYRSGRTGGETCSSFDNQMRSYDHHHGSNQTTTLSPVRRKNSNPQNSVSCINNSTGNTSTSSTNQIQSKKLKSSSTSSSTLSSSTASSSSSSSSSSQNGEDSLFSLLEGSSMPSKSRLEGRPSTGTMERQWEFMRSYFVNNADDELEWLMVSKRKGAYSYAKKKNEDAEDLYFRTLSEIESLEAKGKIVQQYESKLCHLVIQMANLHKSFTANPKDEQATEKMRQYQEELKSLMLMENVIQRNHWVYSPYSTKTVALLQFLYDDSTEKHKAARKAREIHGILPTESISINPTLQKMRRSNEDALEQMEKWSRREKEADEYALIMKQEEQAWLEREREENELALSIMHSFIPVNIAQLTVTELMQQAKERGGYFPLEIASEIKNHKLLQWVVTHREDIAMANFLTGEKKQIFENIEALDLIEMRALAICLPDKFELDSDGKKMEWRNRFMNRVKQLVSQHHGEKVKGPWDPIQQQRTMVALPPLKEDQLRRSIYFYRTKDQFYAKLKQYEDKEKILQRKTTWLRNAEKEAEEFKKEYDCIIAEMRDPEMKAYYGVEQFAKAKDIAKKEWMEADRKRKTLQSEVSNLQKTIASNPISKDQFIQSLEDLKEFFHTEHLDWESLGNQPLEIRGVFDEFPDIQKVQRQAAKFLSAEEEAELRKRELANLSMKKEVPNSDDSSSNSLASSTSNSISTCEEQLQPSNPTSTTTTISQNLVSSIINTTTNSSTNSSTNPSITPNTNSTLHALPREETLSSNESTTPIRKRSVLESANPDMLACLNKMFSPQAGKASSIVQGTNSPCPHERSSCSSNTQRSTNLFIETNDSKSLSSTLLPSSHDSSAMPIKSETPKFSKSKWLQKLVQPSSKEEALVNHNSNNNNNPHDSNVAQSKAPLSFLDQLRARSNPPSKENLLGSQETSKPQLSFLDQIKSRQQPPSDSVCEEEKPPVSFLDQIKARPNPLMNVLSSSSSTSSNKSQLSFLEEIKARANKKVE